MSNIFDFDENDDGSSPIIYDNISALKPSCAFLDNLNPEQLQAVQKTEGPLLVLAGAGTGKTKVLTTRLAYILQNNFAHPWNCLVVTFTNRAANEMKERIVKELEQNNIEIGDVNSLWISTFHSFCIRILKKYSIEAGLSPSFKMAEE